ncbi:MAG: type IV secretion system DotC family protein [Micavibrio sp.]
MRIFRIGMILLFSGMVYAMPAPSHAAKSIDEIEPPRSMGDLKAIRKEKTASRAEAPALPIDIRNDAMRESALSYGARGGLAWRTYQIRQEMETRSRYLDKVFDFRQLLIPAPSGLLIEPPVIGEAVDAMMIEQGGLQAAVADRIYNIGRNARIVSAPRTWRAYLERQWGEVAPPPDILIPETAEDRKNWDSWFDRGWKAGIEQADEIFQADLNRLTADYQGMVRYRTLLSQGMVSPPYALQVDRGVTGDGNEMRIGDRAVSITGLPRFQTGAREWSPANR